MTRTRIHPITGETLTREVRTQTVVFGSLSREVEVPGWYPEGDGNAVHTGQDLAAEEQVFQSLKKDYGERVRMIRKALKLTQVEAGRIIGGGPRAFQKYENGVMVPSEAAVGLLEILYRAPEQIELLRKLARARSPEKDAPAKRDAGRGSRSGAASVRAPDRSDR